MPSKPDDKDTKKTTKKVDDKKPAEYHNFLVIDHTLRPDGFHLCSEEPSKK
jgi:hypothetical protein